VIWTCGGGRAPSSAGLDDAEPQCDLWLSHTCDMWHASRWLRVGPGRLRVEWRCTDAQGAPKRAGVALAHGCAEAAASARRRAAGGRAREAIHLGLGTFVFPGSAPASTSSTVHTNSACGPAQSRSQGQETCRALRGVAAVARGGGVDELMLQVQCRRDKRACVDISVTLVRVWMLRVPGF